MTRRLDSRILTVDAQTYVIDVYADKLLLAPCQCVDTSLVLFTPDAVVQVIPLSGYGTLDYLPLGYHEDELRKLIRLHVLAFDPRRQKREG